MKGEPIKSAIISLFILFLLVSSAACASSQVTAGKQAAAAPTPSQPATQAPATMPTGPASQAPATTQAPALGTKQGGDLTIRLSSNPTPPIRGNNIFEAIVTDAQGKPVSDAKLSFDIDMTNMSHGKDIITASSLGDGRYSAKVNFLMPGPWRMIVSVDRAGQTNKVRFDFNVNWR